MTWIPKTAPFTKYTDFVGQIRIPNLTPSTYTTDDPPELIKENVVGDARIAELEWFIAKYEKQLFVRILSIDVYNDLVTQMALETAPAQKWIDLYNQLMGEAMAANYVYYWYQRDGETSTGTMGEVVPTMENSTRTSNLPKMVRAWNEMSESLESVVTWLLENDTDYGIVHDYETDLFNVMDEFSQINTLGI